MTQPIFPPREWPIPDSQIEPETPDERIGVDLYPVIGQGALSIDDGGGYYNYNQDMTEDIGRGTWQFPLMDGTENFLELLEIFRDILGRVPIDALRVLEGWLAEGIKDFVSVTSSIESIMGSLSHDTTAVRLNQLIEMLVAVIDGQVADLTNWLSSLAHADYLSAGALSKETIELLLNPFFATPVALENGSTPGWSLVGDLVHSATGNSAYIQTDLPQEYTLLSSLVKVEPDKIINLSGWLQWQGITSATGSDAITLALLPITGGVAGTPISVDSVPLATATTDSSGWVELAGAFTVPAAATYEQARLMVVLEELNVGSEVWVSDTSFKKELTPEWWPMDWVENLPDTVEDVTQLGLELHETINDTIASFFGLPSWNEPDLADQRAAMVSVHESITSVSTRVNELYNKALEGEFYSVSFPLYPDGDYTTAGVPFTVTYQGAGDGFVEVSGGSSVWNKNSRNGNREAFAFYTDAAGGDEMDTDYVLFTATVGGVPEMSGFVAPFSATNSAIVRANNTFDTFVYATGYRYGLFGIEVRAEMGCYVAGTKHVWATDIPATYDPNLSVVAGVDGNPYRFKVYSGSQEVYEYTDVANQSQIGASYRRWGFHVSTGDSGFAAPSPVSYLACADIT